jgi:glycosyltransferase involved in cell wall biosynthesis
MSREHGDNLTSRAPSRRRASPPHASFAHAATATTGGPPTLRRVLVVHSRYLSGHASGENRVVADEIQLLRDAGYDVSTLVREVDADRSKAALAADVVWAGGAVRDLEDSIRRHRPDVVHCHNLFPAVSPAVLRAARRAGLPVVVTLHNFRFVCLAGTFIREARICEDCHGRVPWRGVVHGCYRGSRAESAVLASSLSAHRLARTLAGVTLFLALSEFGRAKHVAAGFPAATVRVRPNFVAASAVRTSPGEYFLYLGRLSPEKGLREMLGLWPRDVRLVVVGDGPERDDLLRIAPPGVEFRGALDHAHALPLLADARALVMPSVNYEGSPKAILEAFAAGVPVLASDIGGLPELVHDGVNGVLLAPGDSVAWQGGICRLLEPAESLRLGAGALASWRASYSPERGLESLVEAYTEAMSLTGAPAGHESPLGPGMSTAGESVDWRHMNASAARGGRRPVDER